MSLCFPPYLYLFDAFSVVAGGRNNHHIRVTVALQKVTLRKNRLLTIILSRFACTLPAVSPSEANISYDI